MNGTRKHPSCKNCGGVIPERLSNSARYCDQQCAYKAKRVRGGYTLRVTPDDRFWNAVKKAAPDECWEWQSTTSHGYGAISLGGRGGGMTAAHRHSYEIAYGPIPAGGHILHACENPPCVNPRHLRLGNHDENMADMSARERGSKTKLTAQQVREIRSAYTQGETQKALAARYGVAKGNISFIVTRTTWKHVV